MPTSDCGNREFGNLQIRPLSVSSQPLSFIFSFFPCFLPWSLLRLASLGTRFLGFSWAYHPSGPPQCNSPIYYSVAVGAESLELRGMRYECRLLIIRFMVACALAEAIDTDWQRSPPPAFRSQLKKACVVAARVRSEEVAGGQLWYWQSGEAALVYWHADRNVAATGAAAGKAVHSVQHPAHTVIKHQTDISAQAAIRSLACRRYKLPRRR